MRRWMAAVLAAIMLTLAAGALAEPAAAGAAEDSQSATETLSTADIAKLGRPVSATPTHVTVGNTTQVSGEFFTDMWGNNTSDIDVRTLLHGYNLVAWSSQVQFIADPMVVRDVVSSQSKKGELYTVSLQTDLTYCDGKTPITAKDYVFSLLLCASPEAAELGADSSRYEHIVGYDAYHSGKTKVLSGVRLIDDYTLSIAVKGDHEPFFYDLANIWCIPCPISVLAPGCDVMDAGDGAQLISQDPTVSKVPFSTEILRKTIFDPTTGYMSHPALTSGPYRLVAYDEASGRVDFKINPYYRGNYEGVQPVIDTLTLLPAQTDTMINRLTAGEFDLLNKCVDADVIAQGLAAADQGIVANNYARLGYGFCAFACEKGPQQFTAVRQAVAYCVDTQTFVSEYLKNFGIPVYGYYGMGQWMTLSAMGSLRPESTSAKDGAQWDKISLDGLNHYDPDPEKAKELLIKDGWTLNAQGKKFVEGVDDVRYKKVGKELMRLSMLFTQSEGNTAAAMIVRQLQKTLPAIGFELRVNTLPFTELLSQYYRQNGTRDYDMAFMATNFLSVFDPYAAFSADGSKPGSANVSGLNDAKLTRLALDMHKTEPLNYLGFEQNWLKFQKRYNEVLPTLPLYSNVYFDFHTDWLQNYELNTYSCWPASILYAYVADPATEASAAEDASAADGTFATDAGAEDGTILIE